jgi:class 3 adenylate cyclase/tetratricopeptide (TPR) repeat protein
VNDLENQGKRKEKEGHKRLREVPDLDALFGERGEAPGASDGPLNETPKISAEEVAQGTPTIPQELINYLPPELWRKLNSVTRSRGELINALKRVRSILYLISTFLPRHLVQEKMRRPYAGLVRGQLLSGTLLFSDVSDFTALSERLVGFGQEGAERLTTVMNRYFSEMLDIIAWSDGRLLKFAGDATLVYFPEQENSEQACWAVRAGIRMLRAMMNFAQVETPTGFVQLRMKIGIATGQFLAASLGSTQRMEYVVMGQAVTQTMIAEGMLSTSKMKSAVQSGGVGQLVMDRETAKALPIDLESIVHLSGDKVLAGRLHLLKKGFFFLEGDLPEELDDFEIKAEARRARGAILWNASPQAIVAQIEVVIRQIQSLTPYLSPELVERIVAHAGKRQIDSQYRPTTVLFCGFSGPEILLEMWGEAGVPRVTSLLNAYFLAMHKVITRFGGVISRIDPYGKGNKMLVLFGAPVVHEDDPLRAVSSSLAMNAELEVLNESWRKKLDRHLPPGWSTPLIQHRIGITYGETYAGQVGSSTRREYTVMGDNVNLSARLMGAAEMGRILLSELVREAVADYFLLTSLAPIKVKGKSKPIPIYQVEGPLEDTLVNRAHSRERLVGRKIEQATGEEILLRLMNGSGAILTIQGPAGIGKSHLADTLLNRAEEWGVRIFVNLCHSYNIDNPLACWSAFLRSVAGITSSDYSSLRKGEKFQQFVEKIKLPSLNVTPLAVLMGLPPEYTLPEHNSADKGLQHGPEKRLVLPDVGLNDEEIDALISMAKGGRIRRRGSNLEILSQIDFRPHSSTDQVRGLLSGQTSDQQLVEIFDTVWLVLKSLSQAAPMVVFFEDAHSMDDASVDLVHFLAERIDKIPALLLLARRGEGKERTDGGYGSRIGSLLALDNSASKPFPAWEVGTILNLDPLERNDTVALVSHLLISDLAQVIHDQSMGNPLYIDEITRWYKRTHNIDTEELQGVLQTSNFLQKLILSSLETLPEIQREITKVASVIGVEFNTGEIQALLSPLNAPRDSIDPVTLSNHLRALVREQLIALIEVGADARYAFQQSLVRDVLYNSLPFEERRALHARLAEYLSGPLSARHKVQTKIAAALEGSQVANPLQEAETIAYHFEQAGLRLPAVKNLLVSGEQACQSGLFEKAENYYDRALQHLKFEELKELPTQPDDAERIMPWAIDRVEITGLKLRAYSGKGDVAIKNSDYLSALTAYQSGLDCLRDENFSNEVRLLEEEGNLSCKLALVMPTQGKAREGIDLLRKYLPRPAMASDPIAVATFAWLLWRSLKAESKTWIKRCNELLMATPNQSESEATMQANFETWKDGVKALMVDLSGDWRYAVLDYLSLNLPMGAALASIKQGDWLLTQDDYGSALHWYQQAGEIWRNAPKSSNGRALALYRQAEVYWRTHDDLSARKSLEEARQDIEYSPRCLQATVHSAIKRGLVLVCGARGYYDGREFPADEDQREGKARRWPRCNWQAYDDDFRIAVLFYPRATHLQKV